MLFTEWKYVYIKKIFLGYLCWKKNIWIFWTDFVHPGGGGEILKNCHFGPKKWWVTKGVGNREYTCKVNNNIMDSYYDNVSWKKKIFGSDARADHLNLALKSGICDSKIHFFSQIHIFTIYACCMPLKQHFSYETKHFILC